jgi:hypothetical protein
MLPHGKEIYAYPSKSVQKALAKQGKMVYNIGKHHGKEGFAWESVQRT